LKVLFKKAATINDSEQIAGAAPKNRAAQLNRYERIERDGKYFVTVLRDEKPTPQVVKVGISDGTSMEITGGLQEGEAIVAGGLQSLIEMRREQKTGENTRSPGGGMHRLAP